MRAKTKRRALNIAMVAAAALVVLSGVMVVASVRGAQDGSAALSASSGSALVASEEKALDAAGSSSQLAADQVGQAGSRDQGGQAGGASDAGAQQGGKGFAAPAATEAGAAAREAQGGSDNSATSDSSDASGNPDVSAAGNPDASVGSEQAARAISCTVEIRCDAVLDNLDALAPGKESCVPANGIILASTEVQCAQGDTAFGALVAACAHAGIQLEYAYTPGYDSYYVEGINNLYEFDCGQESGWMFQVNGVFPNYGSSSYEVQNGDVVVWRYTCAGFGSDLGA